MVLERVSSPSDLRGLSFPELAELAREIRSFLVERVAETGGHLGPNLGVVELTLALHRVFDSPKDRIVWDTGHQSYVHKILTGRKDDFRSLRQYGGLSGYPSRAESDHDVMENSHASTALSYAAGLSLAVARTEQNRRVVAVVGDGALTGGMAYEALNQIADRRLPLTIVLNDNGRSYSPTVGGLQRHLAQLRTDPLYLRAKRDVSGVLSRLARPGDVLLSGIHRVKGSLRELVTPTTIFDTLGITYTGPIDGHDIEQVEQVLRHAREIDGPVVVHVLTKKGMGYRPAESDERDHLHGVGAFDPVTGRPRVSTLLGSVSWTKVFSSALLEEAVARPEVVAITAAMQNSVGLDPMAERFPDRVFDVGIAEQHAVTFAAGLALGGLRPVVAVYATFFNRAMDQIMMDVALHKLPVTFVLDRAGVTGNDGPSHHGIYDLSFFSTVPGMVIAAPSDTADLRNLLHTALSYDGPFAIRFAKGAALSSGGDEAPRLLPIGEWAIEECPGGVQILAVGNMVEVARKTALILEERGIDAAVTDARFVKPLDSRLPDLAREHSLLVTIEDHVLTNGFGAAVTTRLLDEQVTTEVLRFGIAEQFLAHGSVAALHEENGLTPVQMAAVIVERVQAAI